MITQKRIMSFVMLGILVSASAAQAQTVVTTPNPVTVQPTVTQLPRGTDWQAIITRIQEGAEPTLMLRLTQKVGSCVSSPTIVDTHRLGDTVSIGILPGQVPSFHAGQMVHVWVNQTASLLSQPLCQYH